MIKTEIVTKRLTLRLIESTDLNSIHILHSLPKIDEFNTLGIPKNIEETKAKLKAWLADHQLIEIKNYTFAIENTADRKFMGLFGFKI